MKPVPGAIYFDFFEYPNILEIHNRVIANGLALRNLLLDTANIVYAFTGDSSDYLNPNSVPFNYSKKTSNDTCDYLNDLINLINKAKEYSSKVYKVYYRLYRRYILSSRSISTDYESVVQSTIRMPILKNQGLLNFSQYTTGTIITALDFNTIIDALFDTLDFYSEVYGPLYTAARSLNLVPQNNKISERTITSKTLIYNTPSYSHLYSGYSSVSVSNPGNVFYTAYLYKYTNYQNLVIVERTKQQVVVNKPNLPLLSKPNYTSLPVPPEYVGYTATGFVLNWTSDLVSLSGKVIYSVSVVNFRDSNNFDNIAIYISYVNYETGGTGIVYYTSPGYKYVSSRVFNNGGVFIASLPNQYSSNLPPNFNLSASFIAGLTRFLVTYVFDSSSFKTDTYFTNFSIYYNNAIKPRAIGSSMYLGNVFITFTGYVSGSSKDYDFNIFVFSSGFSEVPGDDLISVVSLTTQYVDSQYLTRYGVSFSNRVYSSHTIPTYKRYVLDSGTIGVFRFSLFGIQGQRISNLVTGVDYTYDGNYSSLPNSDTFNDPIYVINSQQGISFVSELDGSYYYKTYSIGNITASSSQIIIPLKKRFTSDIVGNTFYRFSDNSIIAFDETLPLYMITNSDGDSVHYLYTLTW